MHLTPRGLALLALPALSNAVSLSDMTPRATGLPAMCEAVYTSQIYGCTPGDFQSQQCSSTCINALYGLSQAISHACAGQTGQNLVVAFLAGVGPQQLCHNAKSGSEETAPPTMYTHGPHTQWQPTIVSSTTTARKATESGPLLIDTSSTMTQTIIPHRTQTSQSSSSAAVSSTPETTTKTTATPEHTTHTQAPVASSQTSSAVDSSQTSLNDHSGGGSPFDTAGNVNSAASSSISIGSMIFSAAAVLVFALR